MFSPCLDQEDKGSFESIWNFWNVSLPWPALFDQDHLMYFLNRCALSMLSAIWCLRMCMLKYINIIFENSSYFPSIDHRPLVVGSWLCNFLLEANNRLSQNLTLQIWTVSPWGPFQYIPINCRNNVWDLLVHTDLVMDRINHNSVH